MLKSSLIAAATLVAGLSLAASAQAHGHGGHHHHFGYGFYAAPIYVAPAYNGCSYAFANWQATGSFFWKKRYYACRGWW